MENERKNIKSKAENYEKIIPAYEKEMNFDHKSHKQHLKKLKKERDKKKIIQSKITIILIAVIIVAIVGICLGVHFGKLAKYKKLYGKYEEPMTIYAFDKVYDNGSAKTTEYVTKSELVKMVIAATLNTSDIDKYVYEPSDDYTNCSWIDYAVANELLQDGNINKENATNPATLGDLLKYFSDAKTKLLKLELNTDEDQKTSKINSLSSDLKIALVDMVNNGIISLDGKKFNENSKIIKGQVNEVISNYVLKYNTITVGDEKVNINEEKIPANKDEYPYTVAGVDKSIYEIGFSINDERTKSNPKDMYKDIKELYLQIGTYTKNYYDTILNIDYNTINKEDLKYALEDYSLYGVEEDELDRYIQYVKDNKIVIEGKASVQYPIIYSDGMKTRVRTKLEFEIKSTSTRDNLLYLDLANNSKITYSKDKYVIYIDNEMGTRLGENSTAQYNYDTCIYDMIIENYKDGITRE